MSKTEKEQIPVFRAGCKDGNPSFFRFYGSICLKYFLKCLWNFPLCHYLVFMLRIRKMCKCMYELDLWKLGKRPIYWLNIVWDNLETVLINNQMF